MMIDIMSQSSLFYFLVATFFVFTSCGQEKPSSTTTPVEQDIPVDVQDSDLDRESDEAVIETPNTTPEITIDDEGTSPIDFDSIRAMVNTTSSTTLASIFDPNLFDRNFLIIEIERGINEIRSRDRIRPLLPRRNLRDAAELQNDYCITIRSLTHTHEAVRYRTVRDRVVQFGGRYRSVGENVQYYGLMNSTISGEKFIRPTSYQQVVEGVVDNWVKSPGHYENMMKEDFSYVGTAIGWDDELTAVFVTQVYGGAY